MQALQAYSWEGNARELMNVMERSVLMGGGKSIKLVDLHSKVKEGGQSLISTGNLKDMTAMYEFNFLPYKTF